MPVQILLVTGRAQQLPTEWQSQCPQFLSDMLLVPESCDVQNAMQFFTLIIWGGLVGKMYSFTHHDGVEEKDNNVANKCPRAQHQKWVRQTHHKHHGCACMKEPKEQKQKTEYCKSVWILETSDNMVTHTHYCCLLSGRLLSTFLRYIYWLYPLRLTTSVVYWSGFLATDPEVPGSIPGATRFSEK
jgi:hypothetical protein